MKVRSNCRLSSNKEEFSKVENVYVKKFGKIRHTYV